MPDFDRASPARRLTRPAAPRCDTRRMSKDHASDHLTPLKFGGVVLVCGDCEERSSGPKRLRAREVRKDLKGALGSARFKLRVLQSSCLGLCPKKAMALAALGTGAQPMAAEVKTGGDIAEFAAAVVRTSR
jgi:hypothetical protein